MALSESEMHNIILNGGQEMAFEKSAREIGLAYSLTGVDDVKAELHRQRAGAFSELGVVIAESGEKRALVDYVIHSCYLGGRKVPPTMQRRLDMLDNIPANSIDLYFKYTKR